MSGCCSVRLLELYCNGLVRNTRARTRARTHAHRHTHSGSLSYSALDWSRTHTLARAHAHKHTHSGLLSYTAMDWLRTHTSVRTCAHKHTHGCATLARTCTHPPIHTHTHTHTLTQVNLPAGLSLPKDIDKIDTSVLGGWVCGFVSVCALACARARIPTCVGTTACGHFSPHSTSMRKCHTYTHTHTHTHTHMHSHTHTHTPTPTP